MAKIIVAFDSEQQAGKFVDRLTKLNIGQAKARVLSSTEDLSYGNDESTSPMITSATGSVEVRPSVRPSMPDQELINGEEQVSASVPVMGVEGVQVMIEVEDEHADTVRNLLRELGQGDTR